MYTDCNYERIKQYFDGGENYKPTVKMAIYTILNHIQKNEKQIKK